jgi:hypothetical protein
VSVESRCGLANGSGFQGLGKYDPENEQTVEARCDLESQGLRRIEPEVAQG